MHYSCGCITLNKVQFAPLVRKVYAIRLRKKLEGADDLKTFADGFLPTFPKPRKLSTNIGCCGTIILGTETELRAHWGAPV